MKSLSRVQLFAAWGLPTLSTAPASGCLYGWLPDLSSREDDSGLAQPSLGSEPFMVYKAPSLVSVMPNTAPGITDTPVSPDGAQQRGLLWTPPPATTLHVPALPLWDFPDKEFTCQCRRHRRCGFDFWVRKIPWGREWQPTPVFLPGKSHGQRSLAGYSP